MDILLSDVTEYMDGLLETRSVEDWPNALNGLQLANMGRVSKIGAAVDAAEATLRKAEVAGVDLLLVHHGLFWGGLQRVTGANYRKLAMAIRADMAVYSAHLPLDLHAKLGNSALLAKAIGLENGAPFFFEKGRYLGLKGVMPITLVELAGRVEKAVGGPVKVFAGGGAEAGRVGLVTGGAGEQIFKAAAEGVDTFVTGEGPHWSAVAAPEIGVNLVLAGHYATETFGVKALAEDVAAKYGLPWVFIDEPTGL